VVSGYHRTAAAEALNMPTIRGTIVEAPDDMTFTLLALKGNLRHGKTMSSEEQRQVVRRLKALGMSESAIAKETDTPKGTIHNWLSGRDTNAGRRSVRHAPDKTQMTQRDEENELDEAWRVLPLPTPDRQKMAQLGSRLHDALAVSHAPADMLAYIATLELYDRESLLKKVDIRLAWLKNLRAVLAATSNASPLVRYAPVGSEEESRVAA
jgi:hypothetical protein